MPYNPNENDKFTQSNEYLPSRPPSIEPSQHQNPDAPESSVLRTHFVHEGDRRPDDPHSTHQRASSFHEQIPPDSTGEASKETAKSFQQSPSIATAAEQYTANSHRYQAHHLRTQSTMQMPPLPAPSGTGAEHYRSASLASDYMYLQSPPIDSPRGFPGDFEQPPENTTSNINTETVEENENLDPNLDPALRGLSGPPLPLVEQQPSLNVPAQVRSDRPPTSINHYGFPSRASANHRRSPSPGRDQQDPTSTDRSKTSRSHRRHGSVSTIRSQPTSSIERRGHSRRRSTHTSPVRSGTMASSKGAGVSKPPRRLHDPSKGQQFDPREIWKYGEPSGGGRPGPVLQSEDRAHALQPQHVPFESDQEVPTPPPIPGSSTGSRSSKSRGTSHRHRHANPGQSQERPPFGLGIGAVEYSQPNAIPWSTDGRHEQPILAPISHEQVSFERPFQIQPNYVPVDTQYASHYNQPGYAPHTSYAVQQPQPHPRLLSRSSTGQSSGTSDISVMSGPRSHDRAQNVYMPRSGNWSAGPSYDPPMSVPSPLLGLSLQPSSQPQPQPSYGYEFPGQGPSSSSGPGPGSGPVRRQGPGFAANSNDTRGFDTRGDIHGPGYAPLPAASSGNWLEFDRINAAAAAQQYAPREDDSQYDDELMKVPGENYDANVHADWSLHDTEELLKLLDNGERYKWKYISDLLSTRQNKRIPIRACQNKFQAMFGESETGSALRSSLFYVAWRSGWDAIKNERTVQEREEGDQSPDHTV